MTTLGFAVRLAWRDARASWRRLGLLTAAVTAGVAALVAVNSFTDNLRTSVAEQAQALLGSDLSLGARAPLDTSAVAMRFVDSLQRAGGPEVAVARSVSLAAMAYVEASGTARLVQLRGVEPGWPFYGAITTEPAGAWAMVQSGAVVVDPSLLTSLGARLGDTLRVGEARFPIAGTVVNVPGEVGLQSAFGARIYVAHRLLPATELLGFGTRAEYDIAFRLPATIDAQAVAAAARPALREARVRIRTVADDRDNLTEGLTRLGQFLGLVALAALLLGGLGTASAVHVLIRQRLDSIAVLRCLGATSGQIVLAFLLQAMGMGLLGALLGAAIGVGLQQAMPALFADLLPVDVQVAASPMAVLLGVGLGIWTAAAFALLPLLGARSVPPLATLRRLTTPPRTRWDGSRIAAILALVASVVGLAAVQVGSLIEGTWFAASVGAALVVLWLASLAVIRLARRFTPRRGSYLIRQGLANLHRPGNQTVTVVLALGFGAFLLTTLFTAQVNLLRDFRVGEEGERPNLVLIDIQPDQRPLVEEVLAREGATATAFTPIVTMRLAAVAGERVSTILARGGASRAPGDTLDEGEGSGLWAVRREYRSTYRGELGPAERVVAGTWFTPADSGRGLTADDPVAVSVEQDLAAELGIGLGARLVWNIQGIELHTVVRSLREVNWARFEPNFFVIFAPGSLEGAPQTSVTLTRVVDPAARGRLQRALAERVPNVTSVDLGEVQRALEAVIGRVVAAIRFMAMFSLATGAIVLIGAIATSRWQRLREGTLLRTLGATRAQVLRILLVEYAALGLAAALVAAVLAGAAGWALAHFVFETAFLLPVVPIAVLAGGLVLLTTVAGLWSSLDVLRRPPLEVLRAE
ncbi:MAG: ABC transporter permease [Gemmatimonadales bacterium]